jgi:hypothetical protein
VTDSNVSVIPLDRIIADLEGLRDELQTDFDERSDRWQEGEQGQACSNGLTVSKRLSLNLSARRMRDDPHLPFSTLGTHQTRRRAARQASRTIAPDGQATVEGYIVNEKCTISTKPQGGSNGRISSSSRRTNRGAWPSGTPSAGYTRNPSNDQAILPFPGERDTKPPPQ